MLIHKSRVFFLVVVLLSAAFFAITALLFVGHKMFVDWHVFSSWCLKTWDSLISFLSHQGTLWAGALGVILGLILLRGILYVISQLRSKRGLIQKLKQNKYNACNLSNTYDDINFVQDVKMFALTAGLLNPKIYVSSAMVDTLSENELMAVIAHERFHQSYRHPIILFLVQAFEKSFFFFPALKSITKYIRQSHEYEADAQAIQMTSREVLASALFKTITNGSKSNFPGSVSLFAATYDRVMTVIDKETVPKIKLSIGVSIVSIVLLTLVSVVFVKAQSGHAHVHEEGSSLETNVVGDYCQGIDHTTPLFTMSVEKTNLYMSVQPK